MVEQTYYQVYYFLRFMFQFLQQEQDILKTLEKVWNFSARIVDNSNPISVFIG